MERYSFETILYITYESKVLDRNMVKIAYSIRDYYVDYYASSLFNEIDDKKKKKKKRIASTRTTFFVIIGSPKSR